MGELGMDSLKGEELRQTSERDFGIDLSVPEFRKLNIKDLRRTGRDDTTKNGKDLDDLIKKSPYRHESSSKCLVPTETIIRMNSIDTGCPLVIIHPLEGSVKSLQSVAESIPCPVYGVQYTAEAPVSVRHLAAWYWTCLKSASISSKVIHLAGYSYGAVVACEMTLQAESDPEQHPKVKCLISLEGSPSFTATYRKNTQHLSKIEKETELLMLVVPGFLENVNLRKSDMLNHRDLTERLNYISEKILSAYPKLEAAAAEHALRLLYSRSLMYVIYEPKYKLRTDIALIKSSEGMELSKGLSDAYDLEKICEGKITVYSVKGDHHTFIRGDAAMEVSKIICEIMKNN